MIPYIEIPPLSLGGYVLVQPFGLLVALACIVGWWATQREAAARGLDPRIVDGMAFWALAIGFPCASLFDVIFYYPHLIWTDPTALLRFWDYMSSYGGFIGGAAGAIVFLRMRGQKLLPYLDVLAMGITVGWFFGRLGCTIVHDHPGALTDFVLGVRFPDGVRHDLGFYEWLYTIFMLVVLYALPRSRMPAGAVAAVVLVLYAPIRFLMDFLRVADATYFGLTPGQYASLAAGLVGVAILARMYSRAAGRDQSATSKAQ